MLLQTQFRMYGKTGQRGAIMRESDLIIISPNTGYEEPEPMQRNDILDQYQRAFIVTNQKVFNNELPPIKIDYMGELADDIRTKYFNDILACFLYHPEKKEPPLIFLQFETPPEMGISTDEIDDLLHELIHYYCYLHNIKDCNADYHNLQFKETAEKHGAVCEYLGSDVGYMYTHWPNKLLDEILKEI